MVQNGWEMVAGLTIMEKIRLCGVKLQEWGGKVSNEYKVKIQDCRKALRKLRSIRVVRGFQQYNETR